MSIEKEHPDVEEMAANLDAVYIAARNELARIGVEAGIVLSLVWGCGCHMTRTRTTEDQKAEMENH